MGKAKARKPAKEKELNLNEIRFVHRYVVGETAGNATRSYEAAGFAPHQSYDALRQAAYDLLTKPHIQAYMQEFLRDVCDAERVTTQSVVRGFRWGAEADVTLALNDDGTVKPKSEWPIELRKAIQAVKVKPIFEDREDPKDSTKTIKVQIGAEYEIKVENKTENRKALAQIRKLIGPDADAPKAEQKPLVVKGADPDKL